METAQPHWSYWGKAAVWTTVPLHRNYRILVKVILQWRSLQIPGYSFSRCDCSKKNGGGVLLYSLSSFTISATESFDDGTCQGLCNVYPSAKLLVAVIYRPADASHFSFSQLLDLLRNAIDSLVDIDFDLFITGDFNFPQIDWESLRILSGETLSSYQVKLVRKTSCAIWLPKHMIPIIQIPKVQNSHYWKTSCAIWLPKHNIATVQIPKVQHSLY